MDDLEKLKKHKERLELERDIARLEREARLGQAVSESVHNVSANVERASKWSLIWVVPVTLFGLFFLFLAANKDSAGHATAGVILLIPALAKVFGKR